MERKKEKEKEETVCACPNITMKIKLVSINCSKVLDFFGLCSLWNWKREETLDRKNKKKDLNLEKVSEHFLTAGKW